MKEIPQRVNSPLPCPVCKEFGITTFLQPDFLNIQSCPCCGFYLHPTESLTDSKIKERIQAFIQEQNYAILYSLNSKTKKVVLQGEKRRGRRKSFGWGGRFHIKNKGSRRISKQQRNKFYTARFMETIRKPRIK